MAVNLNRFAEEIEGEYLTEPESIDSMMISDGYVSDLLSDVMKNAHDNQVWITIMKHLNAVAVASLANIPCIVFANGIKPDNEVVNKAKDEKVCLISSKLSSFQIAGILYKILNK